MLPPAGGRFGDSTAHRQSGPLHVSAHPSPSVQARRACRCARAALWLAALVCQRLRPDPLAGWERLAGTVLCCDGDDRALGRWSSSLARSRGGPGGGVAIAARRGAHHHAVRTGLHAFS
jgi:hypothetical protein